MDIARIEQKIDRTAAGAVEVSDELGGIRFQNMAEVMEFAKLLSVSGAAIPSHLRGNPGACLAICIQALEWRFSPFFVANKSYLVNNRGEERIAYESQLLHAVIEARAPIKGRLRARYEGDGDARVCIVYATPKGETEPLEWRSEPLGKRRPSKNDKGQIKGSPLWESKPDLQQFYDASRDWARAYYPDVLGGVYSKDELDEQFGPERAKDITPKPSISDRLKGNAGKRGFSKEHVERETGVTVAPKAIEHAVTPTVTPVETKDLASAEISGTSQEPQGASLSAEAGPQASDTTEQPFEPDGAAEADCDGEAEASPEEVGSVADEFMSVLAGCLTAPSVMQASREWSARIEAAGGDVKNRCFKARAVRLEEIAKAGPTD